MSVYFLFLDFALYVHLFAYLLFFLEPPCFLPVLILCSATISRFLITSYWYSAIMHSYGCTGIHSQKVFRLSCTDWYFKKYDTWQVSGLLVFRPQIIGFWPNSSLDFSSGSSHVYSLMMALIRHVRWPFTGRSGQSSRLFLLLIC